jgi:hypothetical protein
LHQQVEHLIGRFGTENGFAKRGFLKFDYSPLLAAGEKFKLD